MSKITYNVGDDVMLAGDVKAEVISYNRGWYTLDGNRKVRTSEILSLAAKQDDEEKSLSNTMKKYRKKYTKTTAYNGLPTVNNGLPTVNNGDKVAEALAKLAPNEVVDLAEKVLGLADGELWEKYSHLNPGQQRMCSGNRIRAAVKKGTITAKDVTTAAKS